MFSLRGVGPYGPEATGGTETTFTGMGNKFNMATIFTIVDMAPQYRGTAGLPAIASSGEAGGPIPCAHFQKQQA